MKNEFNENAYACHVPDRPLDERSLNFDCGKIADRIKNEDAWKKGDRNALTLLKTPCMKIVLIVLKGLAEINFHHSGNLVSVKVLEGNVSFHSGDNSSHLMKESLLVFHDKVEHLLVAREESIILLTIAVCKADLNLSI